MIPRDDIPQDVSREQAAKMCKQLLKMGDQHQAEVLRFLVEAALAPAGPISTASKDAILCAASATHWALLKCKGISQ